MANGVGARSRSVMAGASCSPVFITTCGDRFYTAFSARRRFANPPRLSTADRRLAALAANDRPVGGARRRAPLPLAPTLNQILKTIQVTFEYGDQEPEDSPAMPTSGPASSSARPVSPISGTSHKAGCATSHKHGVGTTSTAPTAFTYSATSSTRSITSRTIYALTPPPLAETTSPPWTARPSSRSPHTLPPSLNRAPNDTGHDATGNGPFPGTDPCNKNASWQCNAYCVTAAKRAAWISSRDRS